jgi:hypothetical protein
MIPAILFHAILMWQQAQANTPVAGYCPKIDALCFVAGPPQQAQGDKAANEDWYNPHHHSTAIYPEKEIAPFDVPPAETKVIDRNCKLGISNGAWDQCLQYGEDTTHTERACTDKSRFLLMSEDGKWHCLDLKSSR